MKSFQTTFATFFTIVAFSLTGCTGETTTGGTDNSPPPSTIDTHSHPAEGPHHGALIELGSDEYHAELVHAKQSVTIYLLDGAANKQVPVVATEITINTKHNGQPAQFKLAASPDQDDPAGQSSRFVSSDTDLADHLDEHDAEPRIVVMIKGKSYRGELAHDH